MDFQRVAEIQVVLEGIALPATRDELVAYARREDSQAAETLRQIPEGEYDRLDAVGEALRRTSVLQRVIPSLPQPESGKPPGGDDYVNPNPEPGAVRPSAPGTKPAQETLEEQTKTQKRQQQVQKQR